MCEIKLKNGLLRAYLEGCSDENEQPLVRNIYGRRRYGILWNGARMTGSDRLYCHSLLQAQHLLHAIETFFLLDQPLGGTDGAAGKGIAALGAVDKLDPFT